MRRVSRREKRKMVLTTIICLFIIGLSVISSVSNILQIINKEQEKEILTSELQKLEEKEKILSDDVEKLKNPEYAARYAREKYLYSKTEEKILKID